MSKTTPEAASQLHSAATVQVGYSQSPIGRSVQLVETVPPARMEPPKTVARVDLDRSLLHGIAWTSGVTWLSQILSWGSTLVVVHYLAPSDYGLIGMALLYMGLLQMASELGVGAAVLRFQNLTIDQIRQFNGLAVIAGALGVLISLAAAVPLGLFFREPRLPPVVAVMSLTFLISAFKVVPQALLNRRLQFRRVALTEGAQSIAGALATLTMAILGFRYWALALGSVITATVYSILIVVQSPVGFSRPRLSEIRTPLFFSGHMLMSRFAWYAYSNSDFAVISKTLGEAALGAYTLGWTLSGMAVEKITVLIGRVTPAIFSTVQDNLAELRRYLLMVTGGLALLTFPVCVGMALVASEVVHLALGEKWTIAIVPLQFLAVLATMRSVQPLIPQVLFAIGESRLNMNNALLTAVVLPFGFYLASRWGIAGVAAAWFALGPLMFSPLLVRTLRRLELPAGQYFWTLWPAISGCLIMAAAVMAINGAFFRDAPLYLSLVVKIVVGVFSYTAALFVFHRSRIRALREVLRLLRQRAETRAPLTEESPSPAPQRLEAAAITAVTA